MAKGKANGMWKEVDDKEIIRLYTEENMSLTAIAKHLNYDRGIITRRLHNHNIGLERKPRSDKSKNNTPAKKKLFYKYRMQAKRREISFNLKYKDFLDIIDKECFYCGSEASNREVTKSGHILMYNGIDRVDNTKGYEKENIVSCCKLCNQMKSNLDYDVFINQIKKISQMR